MNKNLELNVSPPRCFDHSADDQRSAGERSEHSPARVIPMLTLEARIKRELRRHFKLLGYTKTVNGSLSLPTDTKESIRRLHHLARVARLTDEKAFIEKQWRLLQEFFADGKDVDPARIAPKLELVNADSWQAKLFNLASLTWSVPVSQGYGRRMRFLVWDANNGKLIGLIGLTDPVFNLKVRDGLIGWSATERKDRLVNMMDAHVLGAVPPYNQLLGGKMLASLIQTTEIRDIFSERYAQTRGLISRKRKKASLVMVTTASALGRSSVYNRLSLNGRPIFYSIGYTSGWGHFHIPAKVFALIRQYLEAQGDEYAHNHEFGEGPNWRLRAIRKAMTRLGFNPSLLRHGVAREVFLCELATNATEFLRGDVKTPNYQNLLSVEQVTRLAKARWVLPRAERRPEFSSWTKHGILNLLSPQRLEQLNDVHRINGGWLNPVAHNRDT